MNKFGVDISKWNGSIDFQKLKAEGVEFVIIKAGSIVGKDSKFEENYKNAKSAGLDVGCYYYTYATTQAEVLKEVSHYLKIINNKIFEYPVYLDIEDSRLRKLDKDFLYNLVSIFGESIEKAGYYFGVYSNVDWYRNVFDGETLNKRFDWWIACWSKTKPININAGIWQFGGSTNLIRSKKIAGILVDQNYSFRDYPSFMKENGLNGFEKKESKPDFLRFKTMGTMYLRRQPRLTGSYLIIRDLPKSIQKLCNSSILYTYAILKKDVEFNVLELVTEQDGRIWGKLDNGIYVSIQGSSGKEYCKKV